MGNRAHVIFADQSGAISPAVYLHWNGGPESVYAFLRVLGERGGRSVVVSYMAARFAGIVAEFFGPEDCQSLGVVNGPKSIDAKQLQSFDHGDNGIYVVRSAGDSFTVDRWRRLGRMKDEDAKEERARAENDPKHLRICRRLGVSIAQDA